MDEADAFAGARQIFGLQEIAQAAIGREDAVADDRGQLGAQPRAVGFGHAFGEIVRRAGIRRGFRRVAQLGVELLDDVADGQLGVDDARGEALAEALDRAVDDRRRTGGGGRIVVIILDVAERRRAAPRGEDRIEGVEARKMVDRANRGQRQHLRRQIGERVAPLIFEDVIGEPVGRVELVAGDGAQRRQIGLGGGALGVEIGVGAEIAEPVGIAEIAAEHRLQRVAPQARRIALLEQSVERRGGAGPRRRGGAACLRWRGLARWRLGESGRGGEQSGGGEKSGAKRHESRYPPSRCVAAIRQ